jgi:hypothetical protein
MQRNRWQWVQVIMLGAFLVAGCANVVLAGGAMTPYGCYACWEMSPWEWLCRLQGCPPAP